MFYREIEPFSRPSTNVLIVVAQYAIFLTYGGGLVLSTELSRNLNPTYTGVILVCANVVVLILVFTISAQRFSEQEERRREAEARRAAEVEDGSAFSALDFSRLLGDINLKFVPPSHCLVYWYVVKRIRTT